MNITYLFLGVQAFCLAAGFGIAYSFLRRTSFQHLSVLLAPIVFPAFLVLLFTLGGHKLPQSLPPKLSLVLAAPFLLYSVVVIWRNRRELVAERFGYRQAACVLGASIVLALPSLAPDITHSSLTYTDIYTNNELLNYSAVSSYLMGRTVNGAYAAAYQGFTVSRTGADLLLASLADVAGAPPANCINFLIACFHAQAIAAFGFLLLRATRSAIASVPWILYSGLALFSLSSLELVNYSVSFLSAYAAAPIVMVIVSLLLFAEDALAWPVLGLTSLLYLYLFISYSEIVALPILIQAAQALYLGYRDHSARVTLVALSPPVIAAALNPLLAAKRLYFLFSLAGAKTGFFIFMPPSAGAGAYFATLFSLRYPYFSIRVFDDNVTESVIAFFLLACVLAACWVAFRGRRQWWIVAGALVLVGTSAIAWLSKPDADGFTAVYKSEKLMIYANFAVLAALVLAVFEPHGRVALRRMIAAGYVVMLICGFRVGSEVATRFGSWAKVYPFSDVASAVKPIAHDTPMGLPSGDGVSSMYWNQILQYYGVVERHGDRATQSQIKTLFDYSAADNDGLYQPIPPAERGAFVVNTVGTTPDHQTVLLNPVVRFGTLLYRGGSFDIYSGPLRQAPSMTTLSFEVVFPPAPGAPEPLVTTGVRENGSFVYVRYPSPGFVQVGYDLWGVPSMFGTPIPIKPGAAMQFRVVLDSEHGLVQVSVDGKPILQRSGNLPPSHLVNVTVGENRIGGGLTIPKFTGEIRNVKTEDR